MTEEKLRALVDPQAEHHLTIEEKAVVEYAVCMSQTPCDVPDELFERLRAIYSPAQIVELTSAIAWENARARFNHALKIEPEGFSEGMYCPVPKREG